MTATQLVLVDNSAGSGLHLSPVPLFSTVQIYDLLNIHFYSLPSWGFFKLTIWPVGLIAQLVEHYTGNTDMMGFNPIQERIFFQAIFSQLSKLCT